MCPNDNNIVCPVHWEQFFEFILPVNWLHNTQRLKLENHTKHASLQNYDNGEVLLMNIFL
jgi:hypothetical protein